MIWRDVKCLWKTKKDTLLCSQDSNKLLHSALKLLIYSWKSEQERNQVKILKKNKAEISTMRKKINFLYCPLTLLTDFFLFGFFKVFSCLCLQLRVNIYAIRELYQNIALGWHLRLLYSSSKMIKLILRNQSNSCY